MSLDRPIGRTKPNARIAATLAAAFEEDPAFVWTLPDLPVRRRVLSRFFPIAAVQSQRHGMILASDSGEAASLWYPPGTVSDGWFHSFRDQVRMLSIFRSALPRGLKVAEAMYARHPRPQPHWYLRYVGVAPDAQGKGWGGAVVRAGVAFAAERGCGVLIETASESNVAIYTRLGFEITEEWEVPDGGPRFWTMIHPAP
ncbi:MAG: GNAT family N-acetyltransferase [Erythrobacter sp.]|nr:GNAT family N-acetyltransferase [Erythrobacter sp.]